MDDWLPYGVDATEDDDCPEIKILPLLFLSHHWAN
jgi:hypothetical protein